MTAVVVAMTTPSTMIQVGGEGGVERERERAEREKGEGERQRGRERGEEGGGEKERVGIHRNRHQKEIKAYHVYI